MKYKAVIFDLFGTLVNYFSSSDYDAVLAEMALVLTVPPADFKRQWSESFNDRITGVHRDQGQLQVHLPQTRHQSV